MNAPFLVADTSPQRAVEWDGTETAWDAIVAACSAVIFGLELVSRIRIEHDGSPVAMWSEQPDPTVLDIWRGGHPDRVPLGAVVTIHPTGRLAWWPVDELDDTHRSPALPTWGTLDNRALRPGVHEVCRPDGSSITDPETIAAIASGPGHFIAAREIGDQL